MPDKDTSGDKGKRCNFIEIDAAIGQSRLQPPRLIGNDSLFQRLVCDQRLNPIAHPEHLLHPRLSQQRDRFSIVFNLPVAVTSVIRLEQTQTAFASMLSNQCKCHTLAKQQYGHANCQNQRQLKIWVHSQPTTGNEPSSYNHNRHYCRDRNLAFKGIKQEFHSAFDFIDHLI